MQAIRQIHHAKDRKITVQLPEDFPAGAVEVIILPVSERETPSSGRYTDRQAAAIAHFLNLDTTGFSEAQRQAYAQSRQVLKQASLSGTDQPRILGLFAGLARMADDFDAPLPDENLFWGTESDAHGLHQEK